MGIEENSAVSQTSEGNKKSGKKKKSNSIRRLFRGRRGYRRRVMITGVAALILVVVAIVVSCAAGSGKDTETSVAAHEKISSTAAYNSSCVEDELGWITDKTQAGTDLQHFWEETGVQPYIILKAYDSSLTTEDDKRQWISDYYRDNLEQDNMFLYVYFADEDTTGTLGYMTYIVGDQAKSVMDDEGVQLFWSNLNNNWNKSNLTASQVLINTFNETADTLMGTESSSGNPLGIVKWVFILLAVIAVIIAAVTVAIKPKRRKRQ